MAELLSTFPSDMLRALTDPRIGISARNKFLPTPADVIEYADKLREKRDSMRDLRRGRVPEPIGMGAKPNPFPRLAAEFVAQPELLWRNFDTLANAAKTLAMHGVGAAADILRRGTTAA